MVADRVMIFLFCLSCGAVVEDEQVGEEAVQPPQLLATVSYTHLTLPTICSV